MSRTKRRVARATLWSFLNIVLSTVVGVLSARLLLPQGRGQLTLILSMTGMSVLVGSLGTNVAVRRLLPRTGALVNSNGYWRIVTYLLGPFLILQTLLFFGLIALTELPGKWQIYLVFIAYGVAFFYTNFSTDLLYAHGLPVAATWANAMGTLATLLMVAACFLLHLGFVAVATAYTVGALCNLAIMRYVTLHHGLRGRDEPKGEKELLRTGLRLLGMNLGQNLTSRLDTLLIGALSVSAQIGFYAVATTPASLLRLPASVLGQVTMHDAAVGTANTRAVLRRTLLIMVSSIPVALVGAIIADWVIPLVFGSAFIGAVEAFRILLLAELAFLPFLVLSRYVAANGSPWGASSAGTIGVFLLVGLCILLVPRHGAVGAAWASLVSYAAMSLTALYWTVKVDQHPRRGATGDPSSPDD